MLEMPATISKGRLSDAIETLEIDNAHATASLSLWGAHLVSFKPKHDDRERLYKSQNVILDGSKSLRAGIPISWPWFARREGYQMHGYIRTRPWRLVTATETPDYTEIVLAPLDTTGEGFDGTAEVGLTVQIGRSLSVKFTTTNTGKEAFEFNAALHTYFLVDDVNDVELKGLSGVYSDKTRDWAMLETPEPYRFTEETDRIHLNPVKHVTIAEPKSETGVESAGHDSVVVWNPWIKNAIEMDDMGEGAYLTMVCVETAVTQGKTLQPQEVHNLTQVIS